MPSVSKKQHNFMAAVANNPAFAKKAGVPQSVGKDFTSADKGKKFKGGGMAKKEMHEEKGEMKKDLAQDKKMIKKAFGMHDKQSHEGKKTNLSKLAKGGVAKTVTKEMEFDYKTGKKSFKGTTAQRDAHAEKEGKIVAKHAAYDKAKKFAAGGKVGQLSKADGVATKGKSKGTMVKMCGGGMYKGKK